MANIKLTKENFYNAKEGKVERWFYLYVNGTCKAAWSEDKEELARKSYEDTIRIYKVNQSMNEQTVISETNLD